MTVPPSNAGAIAASSAAAATSAMMVGMALEEEEERARARRIGEQGADQILWLTRMSRDQTLQAIASVNGNWYVNNEQIYERRDIQFSIGGVIGGFVLTGFILIILEMLVSLGHGFFCPGSDYIMDCNLPFGIGEGLIISTCVGIALGFVFRSEGDSIDYITVGTIGNDTTILITKYNSSGYRNLDEDTILRILRALNNR